MRDLMQRRFEGQLAVVTASTDGIGYAIAERLASEGAKVIISSRKSTNVHKAEAQLKHEGYQVKGVVCHVGDSNALDSLIQEAVLFGSGSIDILISNAAITPVAAYLSETSEAAMDAIWKVNVKSAILLVQKALPYLSKGSSIVLNASIAAFHSIPGQELAAMYSVSKTSLLGVTKAFAAELGKQEIRVNCVAPGVVPTKLSSALTENPKLNRMITRAAPLQRLGKAEEIASVVAFLASKDASYITGETIVCAGGLRSRL